MCHSYSLNKLCFFTNFCAVPWRRRRVSFPPPPSGAAAVRPLHAHQLGTHNGFVSYSKRCRKLIWAFLIGHPATSGRSCSTRTGPEITSAPRFALSDEWKLFYSRKTSKIAGKCVKLGVACEYRPNREGGKLGTETPELCSIPEPTACTGSNSDTGNQS